MPNNYLKVSPKNGLKRVQQTLTDITKLIDAGKVVSWAGPKVRDWAVTRSSRGVDVRDRKYVGYSDAYAEREKGGRHSPVTLFRDGDMYSLTDFKKTSGTSGKVYVKTGGSPNREAVAAAHHHGAGNVPQREWLGMSPSDMKLLNKATLLWLEKALNLKGPGLRKVGGKAFVPKGASVWVNRGSAK